MTRRTRIVVGLILAFVALILFRRMMAERDIANLPLREGPIVAFGDSLTEGIGAGKGESYPDQLGQILGMEVLNRGAAGETSRQAVVRMDAILAENPAIIIILLGGNDLIRQVEVEDTFGALDEIVRRCTEGGAMVTLLGINGLPLLTPNYSPRFKQLASRHRCVYVPDILSGIIGDPKLMSDAIHPNAKGYAIMADRIADALRPHLNHR